MYVQIVLWDLKKSLVDISDLRVYLKDYALEAYSSIEGLYSKIWISDEGSNLWGAVYLWDDKKYVPSIFDVSRAIDLIGYPPSSVGGFSLEGAAEGKSLFSDLTKLGLALE